MSPNNRKGMALFRVDASYQVGTGHVMRCLTLADVLKEQGMQCHFICRKHSGNLIDLIKSKGYAVSALPAPVVIRQPTHSDESLAHAAWLGIDMLSDAEQTIQALQADDLHHTDWLIVDHYALDYRWENKLRPYTQNILAIDDLADRQHDCNLLIDQTFGRNEQDYRPLVHQDCTILTGSQYALLRPEFVKWREYSLSRRANPEFKYLLITMGGVDPDNYTGQILQALQDCKLPDEMEITVVLGSMAPHLDSVKALAALMPYPTLVKVEVTNIAEIMANTDLAIGATGATTWERCCLGLPSIQIVIAVNQAKIAKTLCSVNAISYLRDISQLSTEIKRVREKYKKISIICSAISDGKGILRITHQLLLNEQGRNKVFLLPASKKDGQFVFNLQTPDSRRYFRNCVMPTRSEHESWFNKAIESNNSIIFLVLDNGKKSGMVRVDNLLKEEKPELSIIIDPQYAGKGIGKRTLLEVIQLLKNQSLRAVIHKENISSIRIFEQTGFKVLSQDNIFWEYVYNEGK